MTPAITWSIVALIVVAGVGLRVYWRVYFDRIRRTQDLRERFAASRRAAIQLLDSGQVAPDSETFVLLYLVSSRLVRRSAHYRNFSKDIILSMARSEFRSESASIQQLHSEMSSWTSDVRETWDVFLDNMNFMVVTSMWELRLALKLEKMFGISRFIRLLAKFAEWLARKMDGGSGRLPTGIDVLRTSRRTREWARHSAMAA